MTSTGAGCWVQSSNCPTACCRNISRPRMVRQPARRAAFSRRVSKGLYTMSMTVRWGASSESGTQVSPTFGLMPTGVQ